MNTLRAIILDLRARALYRIACLKSIKTNEEEVRSLVGKMSDSDVLTTLQHKHNAGWWSLRYWGFKRGSAD